MYEIYIKPQLITFFFMLEKNKNGIRSKKKSSKNVYFVMIQFKNSNKLKDFEISFSCRQHLKDTGQR